jgi:hypothetical protein
MEITLHLLGTLLIVELAAAFALVLLVALVGQRGRKRVPFKMLAGSMIYLGICSGLIYGGLWLILRSRGL